jgi:cobyrinic acid a,c-diamide synthase
MLSSILYRREHTFKIAMAKRVLFNFYHQDAIDFLANLFETAV